MALSGGSSEGAKEMKAWVYLQHGIYWVRVVRMKRKLALQGEHIDRVERSRVALKKENAELRAQLARALKR